MKSALTLQMPCNLFQPKNIFQPPNDAFKLIVHSPIKWSKKFQKNTLSTKDIGVFNYCAIRGLACTKHMDTYTGSGKLQSVC